MGIDLHLHSTASDGTDDPAAVIRVAAAAGLHTVALTDHDTTTGWEAAARAARDVGVTLIPGAEISAQVDGRGVHLLAYLYDPAHPELTTELALTRQDRDSRARRMVELIAADHPITWADVAAQVEPGATVGRPHIADALVARGVVADRDEAFAGLLHGGSPYYLPHHAPSAQTVIRLVRAAGGAVVLAHPRSGRPGRRVSDSTIAALAAHGLVGLEADHPDQADGDRRRLRALAGELGLLATGSSDYHGTGKTTRIGAERTDPAVLEALIAAADADRVVHP